MTIVFQDTKLGAAAPQTHVLVIGVGEYSYIVGGKAFNPGTPLCAGLRQLSSSVPSAREFANWVIAHLDNPAAPLGSVEVALSPGSFEDASGQVTIVDTATSAGINKAFDAWYERCDQSESNVAIFYFCGHGLENKITMMLLPEDFGATPKRLGDEIIDFTTTSYAMAECKAKCQLYLLDACRDPSLEITQGIVVPRSLKSTRKMFFPPRDAYILNAAPQGGKAHAPSNGVSFFTSALIRCLDKLGAGNRNGALWEVTTDSLASSMVERSQFAVADGTAPVSGLCTRGGSSSFATVIHQFAHPAEVMTKIDCRPITALPYAHLTIEKDCTPVKQRSAAADPWLCEIEAGTYDIRAQFPSGKYASNKLEQAILYPPLQRLTIPV